MSSIVASAFGGLAIYNTRLIFNENSEELPCLYASINDNCEHVPFNYCVRRRASKSCDPFVVNPYHQVENVHSLAGCPSLMKQYVREMQWPGACVVTNCTEVFDHMKNYMKRFNHSFGPPIAYDVVSVKGQHEARPWIYGDDFCSWSADGDEQSRWWLAMPLDSVHKWSSSSSP